MGFTAITNDGSKPTRVRDRVKALEQSGKSIITETHRITIAPASAPFRSVIDAAKDPNTAAETLSAIICSDDNGISLETKKLALNNPNAPKALCDYYFAFINAVNLAQLKIIHKAFSKTEVLSQFTVDEIKFLNSVHRERQATLKDQTKETVVDVKPKELPQKTIRKISSANNSSGIFTTYGSINAANDEKKEDQGCCLFSFMK